MMDKYIHPTFKDIRGSYTPIDTKTLGIEWDQCSISVNNRAHTFRGLHYQTNPPQTKYIKVIQGSIVDFMVDLETGETDFIMLNTSNAVLIPNNKAHGFLTLEDNTIVTYLVQGEYNPDSEHSLVWDTVEGVRRIVNGYVESNKIIISEKDRFGK